MEFMKSILSIATLILLSAAFFSTAVFGNDIERKEVSFKSEGLNCSGWYYVSKKIKPGEKHPAIVMAHGFSAVKEMNLDAFATKFAEAGLIVLVFDYRFLGASEGEPRGQIIYSEQITDYRNAITWISQQAEVDSSRIGIWGTSYSGAHVLCVAALDKRVKAVVAQAPYAGQTLENMEKSIERNSNWYIQSRNDRYTKNIMEYMPIVDSAGKYAVLPQKQAYDWFTRVAKEKAPSWKNEITIESLDRDNEYNPRFYVPLISHTPLLMIIASHDIITPTDDEKKMFGLAKTTKKIIVVKGGHFDAYQGPAFEHFCQPALDWFKQYLKP
jgi:uncharacterized protein